MIITDSQNTHAEIKTGDTITFGRYTQDLSWEYKPIEWIVLAKEEARILLLSRYGLGTQPYKNADCRKDCPFTGKERTAAETAVYE